MYNWFHFTCVNVVQSDSCVIQESEVYYCPTCIKEQRSRNSQEAAQDHRVVDMTNLEERSVVDLEEEYKSVEAAH